MMRAWTLLLIAGTAYAQGGQVERGAQLFRTQCATPYCHGPDGTAGRAPGLIGHTHSVNSMFKAISWGIPGSGMPEFTTRLTTEGIAALVAYTMTLRAAPSAPEPARPKREPTPAAKEGRALFFDAARIGACGACHELDGWGVPAGPDLAASPPERLGDLRRVAQTRAGTARPQGEPAFPALLVERTDARVRVYDLTARLPVLRSFPPTGLAFSPGSSWRHEDATRLYNDREHDAILRYLRWLAGGP